MDVRLRLAHVANVHLHRRLAHVANVHPHRRLAHAHRRLAHVHLRLAHVHRHHRHHPAAVTTDSLVAVDDDIINAKNVDDV